MKAWILSFFAIIATFSFVLVSCQKEKTDAGTDYTNESSTHSEDNSRFSGEMDAAADDINGSIRTSRRLALYRSY